jgi:hypothetical protein
MISRAGSMSPRVLVRLKRHFSTLPDMVLVRRAHAIEQDRARGGTGLPHQEILDALRPQLRRIYEQRRQEKRDLLRVLETVPRELRAALPIRTIGGFGVHDAPLDLRRSPVGREFRRAESFVQLFAQLNGLAETYGLKRRLTVAQTEMVSAVRALQRGLVREIRAARRGDLAEEYRQSALNLCARLLGEQEMAELKRARPLA